jgi:hypothetical protein
MPNARRPAKKSCALPHDVIRGVRDTVYIGGAVDAELLLVERDEIVVSARHFSAYPEGFAFVLHIWLSEPDDDLFEVTDTLQYNPRRGGRRDRKNVYVTVELPDGTSVTGAYDGKRADVPGLELHTAWGSPDHYQGELVASVAVPDSGPLTIVFDWPARGIVDARASIDAARLTEAARQAQPLFEVADRP